MLFVKGYPSNLCGAERSAKWTVLQPTALATVPDVRSRNKNARALRVTFAIGDWIDVLESHYPGLDATFHWD